jgi:hypothetical protein
MIMPKDSGPKASSKVVNDTFPVDDQRGSRCANGDIPFFRSSKLTVTAADEGMLQVNLFFLLSCKCDKKYLELKKRITWIESEMGCA